MDFGELFSTDEEENITKARHTIRYDYVAPISTFVSENTLDIIDSFSHKMAPQQLFNMMDLLYMRGQYRDALRLATQFAAMNQKLSEVDQLNLRDLAELGARCAVRLGMNDAALRLIQIVSNPEKDPGLLILTAQAALDSQQKLALNSLEKYFEIRGNDFYAWKLVSDVFASTGNKLIELIVLEKCARTYVQSASYLHATEAWEEHGKGLWGCIQIRIQELKELGFKSNGKLTTEDAVEFIENEWILTRLNMVESEGDFTLKATREL
ncbi:hypothetical protein HK096_000722 [Nowakowskiella sp. JEL0078]|nr:hypothetical protein HK096_000722 [Nowakowskiella sp. JEL0078]